MRRVLNKMGQWLVEQTGEPAVWFQVREMGRGDKGDHLHLLVWVPAHLVVAFKRMFRGWVAADSTRKPRKATYVFDEIQPRTILTTDRPNGLQSYLMKEGAPDVLAKFVHTDHLARRTGLPVQGQRAKASHAVGAAVRRLAGIEADQRVVKLPERSGVIPTPESIAA